MKTNQNSSLSTLQQQGTIVSIYGSPLILANQSSLSTSREKSDRLGDRVRVDIPQSTYLTLVNDRVRVNIPQPTSVDFHFISGLYRLIYLRVFSRALPRSRLPLPRLIEPIQNNYVIFGKTGK